MLAKVRKDIRLFSATMIDDIASGKACVAIAGRVTSTSRPPRQGNGSKDVIESLLPSTGALIFFDTMALTKTPSIPITPMPSLTSTCGWTTRCACPTR